ncbi:VapE domain-containing protein [Arcicella rosea]|uniref:Putative P-loop ATPase n=1 Tax=Arcicella rosea TaxID=502909 RepID=A0A841EPH5_9BACT|nr:VapE domain-containing protein [Arcicella rosea]MBB6005135.1 putative P-loop ATPase [Arcicella rosea]
MSNITALKVTKNKEQSQGLLDKSTENKGVTKESNNNANKPLIIRLENFIFSKYDLRVNIVSNEMDGKLKKEKEYNLFTEDTITYDLYANGFNKFNQILPVIISNKVEKYDPIKQYFESLPKWDNSQPDYITELSKYVIIEDKVWWQRMFKKHLVRMVAQGILHIPFNKQCLTLVGKQNDGKTSFLEFLVPPKLSKYYRKGFDFGGNKDGKISLCQNFIINLDELASFEKRELNNDFKTILTESVVKFRPLFGKSEITHYRRANFVASTNQYEFLTDETGNVRWLPFVVKEIKHDNGKAKGYQANIDIDLVWSQAYHLLLSGNFEFIMSKEDIEMQEKINQRFMRISTEIEVIQRNFLPSDKDSPNSEFLTTSEIEQRLVAVSGLKLNRIQIGKALKILHFQESQKYSKEYQYSIKGYYIKNIQNHLT